MPGTYERVRALRPRRSAFNLSYSKLLTCDMGQIIPVMADEMVPGDKFQIGAEVVLRMMPMVAPILHEINVFLHYFFVPLRLLFGKLSGVVETGDWETFITGGVLGNDTTVLPTWVPTHGDVVNANGVTVKDNGVGSLWDYFGFPVTDAGIIPDGAYPLDWPRRAYNMVWNQYFRDETQQAEIALTSSIVKNRAWEKDYFTSAMPWQQRGTPAALPISGIVSAVWPSGDFAQVGTGTAVAMTNAVGSKVLLVNHADAVTNLRAMFNDNQVNLASATTFNVSDLRLAFQIQKWQERNSRAGVRYIEFLMAHFGVAPRDERLQRAEYIGGTKMPIIVSEVLQTSSTDGTSPQGNMAGHGLAVGRDACARYTAEEFGIVLGVMSIMPRTAYTQGINKQWLRKNRLDYYSPEFANLSEQAVIRAEVYADSVSANNNTVFGYQGRFNEMRGKHNMTVGLMRYGVSGSLGTQWHVARNFASAPALNESFIVCVPRKDFLAAPSQPTCIVHVANKVKAIRPLPIESDPGLIDH